LFSACRSVEKCEMSKHGRVNARSPIEELDHLQVVNRHTYDGPRDRSYLYIGRGTPLGNNWSHVAGTAAQFRVETRLDAIAEYRRWLWTQIQSAKGPAFEALQQIKDRVTNGDKINLACSCHPKACHGDVIKSAIEYLVQRDRQQQQTQAAPNPERQPQTTPTPTINSSKALSLRAEQAHADVLAQSASDDYRKLYNVEEGLTRGEHTARLNLTDQLVREAYERGAAINDSILSIPRDPDARPIDAAKVTIGTEVHAIDFVRGFIDDAEAAREKGQRLFELGDKACGRWIDSHGRLAIFTHIYDQIRRDENGVYRTKEDRAAVIDKVLDQTAIWAEHLPEPVPEPTPEEIHQFTLELAEENRAAALREPTPEEQIQIDPANREQNAHLLYLRELHSNSQGLASIGELTGFSLDDFNNHDQTALGDENQIYADMFEQGVLDEIEFAIPEGDHLGAERQTSDNRALDATFERINLDALPPRVLDTLTSETETRLFEEILPRIDNQIENGLSRKEILSPIYEANRTHETNRFGERVAQVFHSDGDMNPSAPTRDEELNALSSLRLLVAAEYRRETRYFTRETIQWAKENYRLNPERLRSAGKLQKGEYQKIIASQTEARSAWLVAHPGQQAPTRAQIARINSLESAGLKINARIEALTPTRVELVRTLDHIQSRIGSTTANTETLLRAYASAETCSIHLAHAAEQFADHVRTSKEFQTLKQTLDQNDRERTLEERQALTRGNDARFDYLTQTETTLLDKQSAVSFVEISTNNRFDRQEERARLAKTLISPEIEAAHAENARELSNYRSHFTQLAGREISNVAEAREALHPNLSGLGNLSAVANATRARLGQQDAPQINLELQPTPLYVSLTSNGSVRIPVATLPEYEALTAAVEDCRLQTSAWTSLTTPFEITGRDEEREELTRFVGQYVDYRINDHATAELAQNPVFRDYSQRLADTRTTEELIETAIEIRLENYQLHEQYEAHLADRANKPSPDKKPLTVSEMRELFLSASPLPDSRVEREQMRAVLYSMTVFGKEKAERVQLLAEGKLQPSPMLSRLLQNLDGRNGKAALNHFYLSLRNPAESLTRQNSFDLYKAHRSLPQYERDYLHNHALAAKYEALNTPKPTQEKTINAPSQTEPILENLPAPSQTGFYQEYYARADLLEARSIAEAEGLRAGVSSQSLQSSSIVPELTDIEVRTISYVVNNFDQPRQAQIAEHLRQSPNERQQAIGDMIKIAGDIQTATINYDVTEFNLELPEKYLISPNSIHQIISYTQQNRAHASHLSQTETAMVQQQAQGEAWRQMPVLKQPNQLLDASARLLYEARDLQQDIELTAQLQERARTAFRILESHVVTCTAKAQEALSRSDPSASETQRTAQEQREFVGQLVKIALDPQRQEPNSLGQQNEREYTIVQKSLSSTDIERATQLNEYAASARNEYLQSFNRLDQHQKAVNSLEARVTEASTQDLMIVNKEQMPAAERYVVTTNEIERAILTDRAQEMFDAKALPELSREQIQNLTIRDLLSEETREAAHNQARELAWQSFEPQELKDAHAGREVDERLVQAADQVMDKVAAAQTVELQLDNARTKLEGFVKDQVTHAEQPIRDERAAAAYENEFRAVLEAAREEARLPIDSAEPHEATQLLQSLDDKTTTTVQLVERAQANQLPSIQQDLVIEAHNEATIHAKDLQQQSLYLSLEEREAAQQQTLSELTGREAAQYNDLRNNIEKLEAKFEQSFIAIDDKANELSSTRNDVRIEKDLAHFHELSQPAAAAINNYLKDTVREEGFKALLEPLRHDNHVGRITDAIIESAEANNISLDQTSEGLAQINEIASNLFDSLSLGLEHANQQYAQTQEFTYQIHTSAHLIDPSLAQTQMSASLAGYSPNGHNHDQIALLDKRHDRQETLLRDQLSGQDSQFEREPLAQTISETPALDKAGHEPALGGLSGQEIAQTMEQAEAVLVL
jgi:Domain of unknown function (DUF4326)